MSDDGGEELVTSASAQVFLADNEAIVAASMEDAIEIYRANHDDTGPECVYRIASQVWTIPSVLLSFTGECDDQA